jgi:hypothetical protein
LLNIASVNSNDFNIVSHFFYSPKPPQIACKLTSFSSSHDLLV